MALACDFFADQTIQDTQQAADCVDAVYELSQVGLDEIPFYLGILDALVRAGFTPPASIPACDAYEALKNLTCVSLPISNPGSENRLSLQAQIAYMVNQYGCSL